MPLCSPISINLRVFSFHHRTRFAMLATSCRLKSGKFLSTHCKATNTRELRIFVFPRKSCLPHTKLKSILPFLPDVCGCYAPPPPPPPVLARWRCILCGSGGAASSSDPPPRIPGLLQLRQPANRSKANLKDKDEDTGKD